MDISIKRQDLDPFIGQALQELRDLLKKERERYGERYNWRNVYEQTLQMVKREKWYDEYTDIIAKTGKLPASMRRVVRMVGDRALQLLIASRAAKPKETEQKQQI